MYLHENIHVTDWFLYILYGKQRNGFRHGSTAEIVSYFIPYRGCRINYLVSA